MNKTRPLSFLQLQKFQKTKWACFIHFWPLGRDMAIFSFFPQFNSCPFFLRHPLPLLPPLSAQTPKCVTLKLIKHSIYLLRRACLVEMAIERQSFRAKVAKNDLSLGKTTILGCFLNKNAMKWYFKKNSLGRLNFYTMVHFEGSCDHIYLKMKKWSYLSPGAENE